ncbi:MAG: thiamine phosphate synthase [Elainellaceae cyanobacterium]
MTDYQPSELSGVVYRILDANLDRAREGLRIIEEWCRFGLNDVSFAGQCKALRQALAQWHNAELRAARSTPTDPGTALTHPNEAQRSGLNQLLQANFCRVQEALRVLEEYGKLYKPEMAASCKQMRYEVYTLESDLLAHQRHHKLQRSQLYLVTMPQDNLLSVVEEALQGGLTLVQYRDKIADDKTRLHQAKQLKQLCQDYDALFLVNDRVDLALAVGADGVHLGQHDVPVALARELLGPHAIVGKSTTSPKEMEAALQEGADYIGVGPVYETPTKAGKAAAGLSYVRYAQENSTVPWFCIGGIDTDNLGHVLGAGATRVAVVRAIMQAEHPTLITQYFLSQLVHAQTMRTHK